MIKVHVVTQEMWLDPDSCTNSVLGVFSDSDDAERYAEGQRSGALRFAKKYAVEIEVTPCFVDELLDKKAAD